MKKIKVIDLLNKIANGEEAPKKIRWGAHELDLFIYDYKAKDELGNPSFTGLLRNVFNKHALNEQIEILEEKKKIPEKLDKEDFLDNQTIEQIDGDLDFIIDKINEIIDYLKSKGE